MSAEPITSAESFTDAQLYAVKMDVVGERLNITFTKAPGQTPYIAFTLQSSGDEGHTTTARGLFGGKS